MTSRHAAQLYDQLKAFCDACDEVDNFPFGGDVAEARQLLSNIDNDERHGDGRG